jgi:hypothetical protein
MPEVVEGVPFSVSFELKNAEGARFKSPGFSGLKVVGGPSQISGMTMVNGKTSTQMAWRYDLEAPKAGTYTIGSAAVTVKGQVLNSKPIIVRVVAPRRGGGSANVPAGHREDLFFTGETDRATAYPGQQVTWRVKLYTQLSIDGADLIGLPDFHGFYSKDKQRFDTRVQYQTIHGKKYAVKIVHEEALFPHETGELTIGSAKIRAEIAQPGSFSPFSVPRPVLFQTDPVTITVKPLPTPVPERFSGGVGLYSWEWQQDKDSLSTDDALTLTFHLRGNGDARRFAAPKLALPPGLEAYDPAVKEEEEYENGTEVVHTKVLEYIIIPKEPGNYSINPELCFFDPDSAVFKTSKGDKPVVFRVKAGKNYISGKALADSLAAVPPQRPVARPHIWESLPVSQIMMGSGMLLLLLIAGFAIRKQRRRSPQPPSAPRPVPAGKIAREHFTEAAMLLKAGNPRAFYDELFKSLQTYLAQALHLPLANLNPALVQAQLAARNVSPARIQAILSVWQTCEQALFAGQPMLSEMSDTWRKAEESIKDLEKMR